MKLHVPFFRVLEIFESYDTLGEPGSLEFLLMRASISYP